jgi:hypothetical protein
MRLSLSDLEDDDLYAPDSPESDASDFELKMRSVKSDLDDHDEEYETTRKIIEDTPKPKKRPSPPKYFLHRPTPDNKPKLFGHSNHVSTEDPSSLTYRALLPLSQPWKLKYPSIDNELSFFYMKGAVARLCPRL